MNLANPLYGDWKKAIKWLDKGKGRFDTALALSTAQAAIRLSVIWKAGIKSRSFGLKANTPLTVLAKGSDTPMVQSAAMVNAINPKLIKLEMWFVGILMGKKASRGDVDLATIAKWHEYGKRNITSKRTGGVMTMPITSEAAKYSSPRMFPRPLKFDRVKLLGRNFLCLVEKANGKVQYATLKETSYPRRAHRYKAMFLWKKELRKIYKRNLLKAVKVG